ncbi:MAG: DUF3126 family protein [Caulobacterales bacterium]
MDAAECTRLSAYLGALLGASSLTVKSKSSDEGDVLIGGKRVASLLRDEDEGELSYSISLAVARAPGAKKTAAIDGAERVRLQNVLRETLSAPNLAVRERPRKVDSAEVYVGDEFIGTVSADEDEGQVLTISVLDIDLEDEG